MEKLAKIDASPEVKGVERDLRAEAPKTAEEFDVLLSRYRKQSPEQYEKKLGNGSFDRQAKALGIAWESEAAKQARAEAEAAEAKAKAEAEAKAKKEAEAKAKAEAEAKKDTDKK